MSFGWLKERADSPLVVGLKNPSTKKSLFDW